MIPYHTSFQDPGLSDVGVPQQFTILAAVILILQIVGNIIKHELWYWGCCNYILLIQTALLLAK